MKKILTIGIMLLFIGMTISSSTGFNLEKQSSIKKLDGKTLYVGGDGPGNYSKIQDAIQDANDGDTIFVFNGRYIENVNVYKSINLIGEDNRQTIIERDQPGATVKITTGFVNISNFNITRSNDDIGGVTIIGIKQPVSISNNVLYYNNHGVYTSSCNQNVTIENNTIDCCKRDWARGVYCSSGSPIIQYNNISRCWWGITFSGNSKGWAINNTIFDNVYYGIMTFTAEPRIANNTIFDNLEGIDSGSGDKSLIENNLIYGNSRYGIKALYHPTISNNIIIWNGNYGIECIEGTAADIINNTIAYNGRNGIRSYKSSPTIIDNIILANGEIGIYYNKGSDGKVIEHNLIAEHNVHGIYCRMVDPVVTNNTVTLNSIGIECYACNPIINYNNIMGNSEYGVYYDYYLGHLDAKYNWWGSADGPSGIGPGSGDKIGTKQILYTPWLTEENPNAYPRFNISNLPPEQPERPSGPTYGKTGASYYYTTKTTDPDDHILAYCWDWNGDLIVDKMVGPYRSGEEITQVHFWLKEGEHEVRVKAVDFYGWESNWSDPLSVKIIKPELIIESITGGKEVTVVIENVGDDDVPNVYWFIQFIRGIVILPKHGFKDGRIDMIPAGEQRRIKTGPILGFGGFLIPIKLEIRAENTEQSVDCKILFFRVTIKN